MMTSKLTRDEWFRLLRTIETFNSEVIESKRFLEENYYNRGDYYSFVEQRLEWNENHLAWLWSEVEKHKE